MLSQSITIRLFGVPLMMGLAACTTLGPDFKKPEMELPASFSSQGMTWKRRSPDSLPQAQAWWKLYGDGTLNQLVESAVKQNQQIASASARMQEARAISKATRSLYFPSVDLDIGASRTKTLFRGPAGGSIFFNSFRVPVDFRYELDVWGKVSRQVEGAKASEAAAEETIHALKLSIAGEVAQTYWALRAVDADRAVLDRTLQVRRKAFDLLTKQRDAGSISDLDLSRAETEIANAEADRVRLDQQRVPLVNALAVLSGRVATGMRLPENPELPRPPSIPVSLPSELLCQRPDVKVALHRVAAANANIGVTTAAMYPVFGINSSGGFDATALGDVLDPAALVWSLGANAFAPLIGQRFLRSQREAAQALHQAASADYRQTVLESIREVENALQVAAILERRQRAQEVALTAARKTFNLSSKRFQSGLVSFLDVVDAERSLLNAERDSNAIRAERLAISVSLIKALGGQW